MGLYLWFSLTIWQRITIAEILEDEWFKKDYKPPIFQENGETNLGDVEAVFKDSEVCWRLIDVVLVLLLCKFWNIVSWRILLIYSGAPCDREERRAANSNECIRVNFHVQRAQPWKLVWCWAGSHFHMIRYFLSVCLGANWVQHEWTFILIHQKSFV